MTIAQVNVAKAKYPLEDERMKGFVDNLDRVNALAEQSEGFVWRLKDESGDATSILLFDDPNIIVNMSVWENAAALKSFVLGPEHLKIMKQKSNWFEPLGTANFVIWPIASGHIPTAQEAKDKLNELNRNGESESAFSFRGLNKYGG